MIYIISYEHSRRFKEKKYSQKKCINYAGHDETTPRGKMPQINFQEKTSVKQEKNNCFWILYRNNSKFKLDTNMEKNVVRTF